MNMNFFDVMENENYKRVDDYKRPNSRFPAKTPVAMAYVPLQKWKDTYSLEEAFDKATLFPDLNLPFLAYKQ